MVGGSPISLHRLIVCALAFLTLAAAAFLFYLDVYTHTPDPLIEEKSVIIPPGASVRKTARILEAEHIIRHPILFSLAWRIYVRSAPFRTGEYLFIPGDTPRLILDRLTQGKVYYRHLTIPEGYTTAQALAALQSAAGLTGSSLTEPIAEGAFLPDTYFYTWGETRTGMAKRMMQAKEEALDRLWRLKAHTALDKRQAVILASLVEKETGKKEERSLIAAVFLNRLKKGMPLQSDPTVIYAITGGKFSLERPLTRTDLRIRSPYNTYLHPGLPQGPICNPGLKSLEAVLHPSAAYYLYFVADGSGGHRFARTLKEHNRNVARYKKRTGEQGK